MFRRRRRVGGQPLKRYQPKTYVILILGEKWLNFPKRWTVGALRNAKDPLPSPPLVPCSVAKPPTTLRLHRPVHWSPDSGAQLSAHSTDPQGCPAPTPRTGHGACDASLRGRPRPRSAFLFIFTAASCLDPSQSLELLTAVGWTRRPHARCGLLWASRLARRQQQAAAAFCCCLCGGGRRAYVYVS